MATAQEQADRFERASKKAGLHPTKAESDGGLPMVRHLFGEGDFCFDSVWVNAFFDEGGESVHFASQSLARVRPEQAAAMKDVCNNLNTQYRWVSFYVDEDLDVMAQADAFISDITCGEVCVRMVRRMASIINEGYRDIMRAAWA